VFRLRKLTPAPRRATRWSAPPWQARRSDSSRRQILRMQLWARPSSGKVEAEAAAAMQTRAAGGDRWAPPATLAEATTPRDASGLSGGLGWAAGAARDRSQRAA
jgi:hypothetical protein